MKVVELMKIAPVLEPQDHNAGVDVDSINLANYDSVAFVFTFGELTGDATLNIYEGATEGAKTTAKDFYYRATGTDLKSIGGDTLGSETLMDESVDSGLTLAAATYEDRMLVVEIDGSDLTGGLEWVTPELSSAASELFVSCVAVCYGPRYGGNVPAAAIS